MESTDESNMHVRKGTATRSGGRETSRRILDSTRALLMEDGYAGFSMRNSMSGRPNPRENSPPELLTMALTSSLELNLAALP